MLGHCLCDPVEEDRGKGDNAVVDETIGKRHRFDEGGHGEGLEAVVDDASGADQAPFSNCLIQNGDLGGEVELINLPLIFVVYCSNYNGAPVKMVSFSTVPPPPVESGTLHGRLKRGAT